MNKAWLDPFSHLLQGRLDHAPLLIKCGHEPTRGSVFRFLNMWRNHPRFLDVVKEAWQTPVNRDGMPGFHQKLMITKMKL